MINFLITIICGIAIGAALKLFFDRKRSKSSAQSEESSKEVSPSGVTELYSLADDMDDFFQNTAHPKDLLESPDFIRCVKMLDQPNFSDDLLIDYYTGDNTLISCMALEALNRRSISENIQEQIIRHIGSSYSWSVYFALRTICKRYKKPVIGAVLAQSQEWWSENRMISQFVNPFIRERVDQGEKPGFGDKLKEISEDQIEHVENFLKTLDQSLLKPLLKEFEQRKLTQVNTAYLNSVGHLWNGDDKENIINEHDVLVEYRNQIEEALFEKPSRSVLLVGESGVGKTVLIRALAEQLKNRHWRVFEASATDVLAGQVYIGELEARIQSLIKHLDKRRGVLWFVPNFHELFYAGRHRYSPTGVLDMLIPFIDNGNIKIVGETHPTAFERLKRESKRINSTFEVLHIQPLDDDKTLNLAHQWADQQQQADAEKPFVEERTLKEAFHLAKQFLSDKAAPGNLLNFLKFTQRHLLIEKQLSSSITIDDLFITLSHLTGLPRSILDDRKGLNLDELRELFQQRVLGQPEAVDCLIERVAMIKSGLTDPSRPSGVFLFAGPTGTDKTEIAKTLTEFLFGSPERMIRLDMSEFRAADSLDRIMGDTQQKTDALALVNQIRKQPFSVILLDEFEKAHPNVWDLFLQVFDDGRLTDRNGNTADFRHSIIILTSNLGATIDTGESIGFTSSTSSFSLLSVEKAIKKTFRREFVNRIDRVVVFRPLSRTVMREILYNDLDNIFQRRGLRNREWAVEWEDSAIEFLLEKGFAADLGARPLKRAIERYLLSPLAITIVNHQFPEGDQFLFVRSDGTQINVEFIDPEPPEAITKPSTGLIAEEDLKLKSLVLETRGTRAEVELLQNVYNDLLTLVTADEWQQNKQESLEKTSSRGFWESPGRYILLGEIEYMDRIESGLETAGSLINRLVGSQAQTRTLFSIELVNRLAQQLYLLVEAYTSFSEHFPKDAFLHIEARPKSVATAAEIKTFARQLSGMYQLWAKKRRMHFQVLQQKDGAGNQPYDFILAISGFGAYSILKPESGLHVLEILPKQIKITI